MLYPDLVARTCGFIGVFGTLITIGIMDSPEFLITPQPSYAPLEIQIISSIEESEVYKASETLVESETPDISEQVPSPEEPLEPTPDSAEPSDPQLAQIEASHQTPTVETAVNSSSSELMVKPKQETPKPAQPQEPEVKPKQEVKQEPKPEVKKESKPAKKPEAKPKEQPKKVAKSSPQESTKPKAIAKANTASKMAPKASAQDNVEKQRMQSQVANLLVQEIKRKLRYPRNAIRRKLEGVVQVEFSVNQGKIKSFRLSKSSGHKILDDAAKKLAQNMVNMSLPFNTGDTVVVVPIKYELL